MQTKTHRQEPSLVRLRSLTHLLDNAIEIPGTRLRVGLDPIVGLLPGAGDVVTSALSAYIVLEAARFGLPRATLTRMVLNLMFDALIGMVPLVGDFFDATWKANSENLKLLESHIASSRKQTKADQAFIWLLILGFLVVVVGLTMMTTFLIGLVWGAIFG